MRITLQFWLLGIAIALLSSVSFAQVRQKQLLALHHAEAYQPIEKDLHAVGSSMPASAPVTQRDQRYFQDVTRASQTEIMASQMAAIRANSPAVRQFARHTVVNHTTAVGKLNGFAQRKKIALSLQPTEAQQKMLERLNALSGEEFDQLYIKEAGIRAHEDTLELLKRVQKSGQDDELKLLALELQAPVEMRIGMIKAIANVN
jgi:putative membrane protein